MVYLIRFAIPHLSVDEKNKQRTSERFYFVSSLENMILVIVNRSAEEILTMLLEASEEEGVEPAWDGGRIVWNVHYSYEGDEDNDSQLASISIDQPLSQRIQQRQMQHHLHHHIDRKKLQARLEIQKDDIQAVLPISKVIIVEWKIGCGKKEGIKR